MFDLIQQTKYGHVLFHSVDTYPVYPTPKIRISKTKRTHCNDIIAGVFRNCNDFAGNEPVYKIAADIRRFPRGVFLTYG